LLTMVGSLLDRHVPVLLITPRRSPLRDLAGEPAVLTVLDADADPAALRSAVDGRTRYVVVVDDAELLRDTLLDDTIADLLRQARDSEQAVILAGTTEDLKSTYRGAAADALRSRAGLLLHVRAPDDGEIFGIRLPRNAASGPTGRALLVRAGSTQPVQVALPNPARTR
jgi:S-DNA-T family DNA segregation ATPase FtsK/SpoIIIE